jgi:coatomer protein complex subunit gamma
MQVEQSEDESAAHLRYKTAIPLPQLKCDVPGVAYVVFERPASEAPTGKWFSIYIDIHDYNLNTLLGNFSNTLKFVVKDCDPQTGEPDEEGFDDEYLVCSLSIQLLQTNTNKADN